MTEDFPVAGHESSSEAALEPMRPQYRATCSPVYRAVWQPATDDDPFEIMTESPNDGARSVMDGAVESVRRHRAADTLWGGDGRVHESVLADLATIGYWGLMIDPAYGGSGVPFRSFAPFLTRMAAVDPTVAALGSVHSCIGAVQALQRFGSESQRRRLLPDLATGRRLSAFALTEPGAGSDLTALRTCAQSQGDTLRVHGEKIFVTNLAPGRTLLLICRIDEQLAALVCELPTREDGTFRLREYGLHALRRTWNRGVCFSGYGVPAANRLSAGRGDGRTIAYHGLNYARIGLGANASGTLRRMLVDVTAWARHRHTFGQPIATRQLVRYRLAKLAGLIVACDALVAWSSGWMDRGYRGELEGMVAKIFASDSLREAAVDLTMKTHGGRAFLHDHPWGDRLYDYLAPSIYEGEGELLRLAFFHALAKHGGATTSDAAASPSDAPPQVSDVFQDDVCQAHRELRVAAGEIRRLRERHGAAAIDQQCRMAEIADRVIKCTVILCTCRWASRTGDDVLRLAAQVIVQDLERCLSGQRRADAHFRDADRLGEAIIQGEFAPVAGIEPAPIVWP
ncbi:MAG: acyl-CoA/acyl-ACP dehydrogenase [Planctomycetes bacterium]|nr:acyl-CoA/acyl-ACP dehydrogenase [Planctomycetota bacterium]